MNLIKQTYGLISAKMLLLVFALSMVVMSCSDDDDNDNKPSQTVLDLAVANDNLDVLAAAAAKAELTAVLDGSDDITVFAPTDAAFITMLDADNETAAIAAINGMTKAQVEDLLKYHVVMGELEAEDIASGTTTVTTVRAMNNKAYVTKTGANVTINGARVTSADVDASNGVIHIIDAVLTPPAGDIVSIATTGATAENFQLLAAALTKANLVTTLQGNGPFTVFAPSDAAFLAMLRTLTGDVDLTEAEAIAAINGITTTSDPLNMDELTNVLKYHVVSGAAYSNNLTDGQVLTTLKGSAPNTLMVDVGTSVMIDGLGADGAATVTGANVSATNGVIHVIDKVLMFE